MNHTWNPATAPNPDSLPGVVERLDRIEHTVLTLAGIIVGLLAGFGAAVLWAVFA